MTMAMEIPGGSRRGNFNIHRKLSPETSRRLSKKVSQSKLWLRSVAFYYAFVQFVIGLSTMTKLITDYMLPSRHMINVCGSYRDLICFGMFIFTGLLGIFMMISLGKKSTNAILIWLLLTFACGAVWTASIIWTVLDFTSATHPISQTCEKSRFYYKDGEAVDVNFLINLNFSAIVGIMFQSMNAPFAFFYRRHLLNTQNRGLECLKTVNANIPVVMESACMGPPVNDMMEHHHNSSSVWGHLSTMMEHHHNSSSCLGPPVNDDGAPPQ